MLATRLDARPVVISAAVVAAIIPLLIGAAIYVHSVAAASLAAQEYVRGARQNVATALRLQIDEETGMRGFAATRDRRFLAPYSAALPRLHAELAALATAVRRLDLPDAPDAERAVAEANAINARWLREVAEPVLRGRPANALALQVRGKALIDTFRARLDRVDRALTARQEALDAATADAINRILLFAVAAVVVIVGLSIAFGERQARLLRRLNEARRLAAERRRIREFQTVGQAMEQMLWTAPPSGTADYYSQRWCEYAGLQPSELLARDWPALVHPRDRATLGAWDAARAAGDACTLENRLRRADGTYRWHRHRILPMRDGRGALVAWFATSTDVDEEKREVARLQAAYAAEKRIADTLQQAFMQQALPVVEPLQFSATYVPATEESRVGGDWYDAFALADGRVFFSIGDVAGHGLEAAIVMSRARQAILAAALHEINPSTVLARANATLLIQDSAMVTAACGYIEPMTLEVHYAAAGHPPPALAEPGTAPRLLQTGGLPLSVVDAVSYDTRRLRVQPGAMLVLYTDGAIEHDRDPLAGESTLLDAIERCARVDGGSGPAERIYDCIFEGRAARDDVAIMTVTFGASAAAERTCA